MLLLQNPISLVVSCLIVALTSLAYGDVTVYTDEVDFTTATGGVILSIESFESLNDGANAGPFNFTGGNVNTTSNLVFATSAASFVSDGVRAINWQNFNDGNITFTLTGGGINAFAIDLGDLGTGGIVTQATLSMSIDGGGFNDVLINHTGAPAFLGVHDNTSTFSTVTFSNLPAGDAVGMDRLQFGTGVPEPNLASFFGLAMVGLATLRQRRGR
jgi:hypothetical protein